MEVLGGVRIDYGKLAQELEDLSHQARVLSSKSGGSSGIAARAAAGAGAADAPQPPAPGSGDREGGRGRRGTRTAQPASGGGVGRPGGGGKVAVRGAYRGTEGEGPVPPVISLWADEAAWLSADAFEEVRWHPDGGCWQGTLYPSILSPSPHPPHHT